MPPLGRSELTGPTFGTGDVRDADADLTVHGGGEAIGERIIVHGRVPDSLGRPVRTRSWRSGRPTPPAATSTASTSTRRRSTRTSSAPAAV